MQARSSSSGQMVTWKTSSPDWTGEFFPGPGSAQHVAALDASTPGGDSGTQLGKACTPEQFGAQGDGTTDDQAAFTAAAAAITAGTYKALVLGARTYKLSTGYSVPANSSLIGQGSSVSILYSTANITIVDVATKNGVTLEGFRVLGSGSGGAQDGIHAYSDDLRAHDIAVDNCGNTGVVSYIGPGSSVYVAQNWSQVRVTNCVSRGFDASREYVFLRGLQVAGCGLGLAMGAGNIDADVMITGCTLGLRGFAGGNDGHSIIRGQINHNTAAVQVDAVANGLTFDGCHIYEGSITVAANTGMVQFSNCVIDATSYNFTGSLVKFTNCRIDQAYYASYNESSNPDVEWLNCRELDGTVPSWIASRVRKAYTFPSDANQTLSKQDSRAEVLDIQSGTITTIRTLTLARPPGTGETIVVINRTSYKIDVKWSSGAAVSVTTSTVAVVGADGTNALKLSL